MVNLLAGISATVEAKFDELWWGICKGLMNIINLLEQAFTFVVGGSYVSDDGATSMSGTDNLLSQTFVRLFGKDGSMSKVYWSMVIICMCLMIIFVIIGAVRAQFQKDGPESLGKMVGKGFWSILKMLFVPVFFFISLAVVGFIFDQLLTLMAGNSSSSLVKTLCNCFSKDPKIEWNSDYSAISKSLEDGNFDFLLCILTGCCLIVTLATATLAVTKRFVKIFFYYVTAPMALSKSILDEGKSWELWKDNLLAQLLGAGGVIISMYIFVQVVPMVSKAIDDTNFDNNNVALKAILKIVFILGMSTVPAGSTALMAQLVSQGAGQNESNDLSHTQQMLGNGMKLAGAVAGKALAGSLTSLASGGGKNLMSGGASALSAMTGGGTGGKPVLGGAGAIGATTPSGIALSAVGSSGSAAKGVGATLGGMAQGASGSLSGGGNAASLQAVSSGANGSGSGTPSANGDSAAALGGPKKVEPGESPMSAASQNGKPALATPVAQTGSSGVPSQTAEKPFETQASNGSGSAAVANTDVTPVSGENSLAGGNRSESAPAEVPKKDDNGVSLPRPGSNVDGQKKGEFKQAFKANSARHTGGLQWATMRGGFTGAVGYGVGRALSYGGTALGVVARKVGQVGANLIKKIPLGKQRNVGEAMTARGETRRAGKVVRQESAARKRYDSQNARTARLNAKEKNKFIGMGETTAEGGMPVPSVGMKKYYERELAGMNKQALRVEKTLRGKNYANASEETKNRYRETRMNATEQRVSRHMGYTQYGASAAMQNRFNLAKKGKLFNAENPESNTTNTTGGDKQ